MPLHVTRSASSSALWSCCASRLLDETGNCAGPSGYPSFLWIAHRNQRDALFEGAAERGLSGWLAPPIAFLSQLRALFDVRAQPIGILTARLLVARLAREVGIELSVEPGDRDMGPARSHMLDSVFSELLPEGVTPEELRAALDRLPVDGFGKRRNAWVAEVYERFLGSLRDRERYDPRSIHAIVAARIEDGALLHAIQGATRLHIYGITSLGGRHRLFRALAEQTDVEVRVYLPREDEASEWDDLTGETSVAGGSDPRPPIVQPTPDPIREATWVAARVKRLVALEGIPPYEIAVVARSGHRDTRIVHRALEEAGVPSTARIRTRLAAIPCLTSLLELFHAHAVGWKARELRQVLASPYFGPGIDLRAFDHIKTTRRVAGLDAWSEALAYTRSLLDSDRRRRLNGAGVDADRLDKDIPAFEAFREAVAPLSGVRSERGWIELTLEILGGERFDVRRRLCRPVGDRWDIVRLDQQGVLTLEALLREWRTLVDSPEELRAEEWHTRLRRLLEANEIALSTPLQAGVQVLEAHEAALTPFRHTFVVHANDGVFPRAFLRTGVFSDAERGLLRDFGLPLSHEHESLRRERTLWRAVTQGDRVTISYRSTDANGIPRLPSLMVPAHDPTTEIPRTTDRAGSGEEPRDRPREPVSPAEHRRVEVARLLRLRRGGDDSPFRTSEPVLLRHAILTAFAEELRAGRLDEHGPSGRIPGSASPEEPPADPESLFGNDRPLSERPHPWNGRLRDPVVLVALAERFGADYVWSASQLQQYAIRPFDFLIERVLRLTEIEEAEEETSPLAFGTIAHEILERFYDGVKDDLPVELDDRTAELFERVAREVFERHEADTDQWLGLPPLWAVTRGDVLDRVREFLVRDLAYLAKKSETPILLEQQFGFDGTPPVGIEGADRRGRPAALLLRGRIDRVDRCGRAADAPLKVIDYKAGGTPAPAGYRDGALLQSALYMKVVESLGHGRVREGIFRSIRRNAMNRGRLARDGLDAALAFALSIPRRVRGGLFEAVQAESTPLADWQTKRQVTRYDTRISAGSRFDPVTGGEIDPGV